MRRYIVVFSIFLLLLINGCAIPFPHQRLHEYGVQSKLIDEETHLPLNDAVIFSASGDEVFVRTDKNGDFFLPPVYGWHGGYFVGVISLSFWPDFDIAAPCRDILICVPEYKVARISVNEPGAVKDDVIQIKEVKIKK